MNRVDPHAIPPVKESDVDRERLRKGTVDPVSRNVSKYDLLDNRQGDGTDIDLHPARGIFMVNDFIHDPELIEVSVAPAQQVEQLDTSALVNEFTKVRSMTKDNMRATPHDECWRTSAEQTIKLIRGFNVGLVSDGLRLGRSGVDFVKLEGHLAIVHPTNLSADRVDVRYVVWLELQLLNDPSD